MNSFCEQCGATLGEGAKFCATCGTEVVAPPASINEPAPPESATPVAVDPPGPAPGAVGTSKQPVPNRPASAGAVAWWSGQSRRRKKWLIVAAVLVLLVIIAAAAGKNNKTSNALDTTPTTPTTTQTKHTKKPKVRRPSTPRQRVRLAVGHSVDAGGYAGTLKITGLSFAGNVVDLVASTPQGGFDGPKCGDLDAGAQAIFQKIYDGTGWKGAASIAYVGGLVSTVTGKPLPHAETGGSRISAAEASQINWSNSNQLSNINWSLYRTFCVPALH